MVDSGPVTADLGAPSAAASFGGSADFFRVSLAYRHRIVPPHNIRRSDHVTCHHHAVDRHPSHQDMPTFVATEFHHRNARTSQSLADYQGPSCQGFYHPRIVPSAYDHPAPHVRRATTPIPHHPMTKNKVGEKHRGKQVNKTHRQLSCPMLREAMPTSQRSTDALHTARCVVCEPPSLV